MIKIEEINIVNISLEGNDVYLFRNLLIKLNKYSFQTGFKKPFDKEEIELIRELANQFDIDNNEQINITSEMRTIKE